MFDHREILDTWFGRDTDTGTIIGRKSALWWGKDPELDADLRRRFEVPLQRILALESVPGGLSPEQRLAWILLADQVTRGIYRDTPAAFSGDALALSLTLAGLEQGEDRQLSPVRRVFFYMPLEHSESLACQRRSEELFGALLNEVDPELEKPFREYLDFARRHREIIERFGRFPHRNRILGRESVEEELKFLEQPGSGF